MSPETVEIPDEFYEYAAEPETYIITERQPLITGTGWIALLIVWAVGILALALV